MYKEIKFHHFLSLHCKQNQILHTSLRSPRTTASKIGHLTPMYDPARSKQIDRKHSKRVEKTGVRFIVNSEVFSLDMCSRSSSFSFPIYCRRFFSSTGRRFISVVSHHFYRAKCRKVDTFNRFSPFPCKSIGKKFRINQSSVLLYYMAMRLHSSCIEE